MAWGLRGQEGGPPAWEAVVHLSQLLLPGNSPWSNCPPCPSAGEDKLLRSLTLRVCGAQTLIRNLLGLDSSQVGPRFVPSRVVVREGQQSGLECGQKGAQGCCCVVVQIGWIGADGVPSTR